MNSKTLIGGTLIAAAAFSVLFSNGGGSSNRTQRTDYVLNELGPGANSKSQSGSNGTGTNASGTNGTGTNGTGGTNSTGGVPGSGETPWMDSAGNYIGTSENGNSNTGAQVDAWNAAVGADSGSPWCASFVNASLAANGISGTGSASSQSFKTWGVAANGPVTGAVVVFSNGDGTGHVGFVQSVNSNGTINVLGGNQGNSVNVSTYNTSKVVAYRLPSGYSGGGTSTRTGTGTGSDINNTR